MRHLLRRQKKSSSTAAVISVARVTEIQKNDMLLNYKSPYNDVGYLKNIKCDRMTQFKKKNCLKKMVVFSMPN